MENFFKKHWLKIAGLVVGAIGGYLYYHFVGCNSGSCPITSNPWRMTAYGSVLGLLVFDIFKQPKTTHRNDTENK